MLLYRLLCSDRYGKWSVFFKIFEVKSQLGPLLSKYLNTNNKYQNFISKKLLIFMHPNLVGLYITVGCSRYYKMHTRGTWQRKTPNLLWHLFYFCLLRFFFCPGGGGHLLDPASMQFCHRTREKRKLSWNTRGDCCDCSIPLIQGRRLRLVDVSGW